MSTDKSAAAKKVEEIKQAFVMKYRLIAFDKDGNRRCNEEDMLIGIDEICEAVIAEKSPSNEQIHEAALAWAKEHSEAPDKDCPTWLIRDYEAGAYFVRQCMGCWNKTEPDKSEVDKMVSERLKNAPRNCPKAAQCAHVKGGLKCPPNVICPL